MSIGYQMIRRSNIKDPQKGANIFFGGLQEDVIFNEKCSCRPEHDCGVCTPFRKKSEPPIFLLSIHTRYYLP